jgi:hypothetical protein
MGWLVGECMIDKVRRGKVGLGLGLGLGVVAAWWGVCLLVERK